MGSCHDATQINVYPYFPPNHLTAVQANIIKNSMVLSKGTDVVQSSIHEKSVTANLIQCLIWKLQ